MTKTRVFFGLVVAGVLAMACSSSSGPTAYVIDGTCGPLPVNLAGVSLALSGPCNLGPAGSYTLDAGLSVDLGTCGTTPVAITADWIQGSSTLHSTFVGVAELPCPLAPGVIPISGKFTYAGGTGPFLEATGSADADGGVAIGATSFGPANLNLTGSLTY